MLKLQSLTTKTIPHQQEGDRFRKWLERFESCPNAPAGRSSTSSKTCRYLYFSHGTVFTVSHSLLQFFRTERPRLEMLFLLGFPLTDSKSTSLPPTGRRSAALRRGLFSCHILKIGLHPCGAVFLHLLGDTTVNVGGEKAAVLCPCAGKPSAELFGCFRRQSLSVRADHGYGIPCTAPFITGGHERVLALSSRFLYPSCFLRRRMPLVGG